MKSFAKTGVSSVLLAALMTACGGGSSGSTTNTRTENTENTAISAMSAPESFSFATIKVQVLTAVSALQAVGGFTSSDATKAYVKVWYVDASSNQQQLAFMSLAAFQAIGASGVSIQVPIDIRSLVVEIYDSSATKAAVIAL